jgi:hypothetical protein
VFLRPTLPVIGSRSTIDLIVTTKKKAKIFDVYDSIRKPFFIETPPKKKILIYIDIKSYIGRDS